MFTHTMTSVPHAPAALATLLEAVLSGRVLSVACVRDEVTVTVSQSDYFAVMQTLRDEEGVRCDQLIDLCGVDYSAYEGKQVFSGRYAVVVHLLSVYWNHRVRVRVLCDDDDFPRVESVNALWASASWYEREAFDLYGIVFDGHEDLRRILTDYGFIGHPFRKDFPLSGYVEMRYDADRKRVVYEPVSIEPRENTPRIVREENYGGLH